MDLAKIRKKAQASSEEKKKTKKTAAKAGGKKSVPKAAGPSRKKSPARSKKTEPSLPQSPAVSEALEEIQPGRTAEELPIDGNPAAAPEPDAAQRLEKLLLFSLGRRKYAISIAEISQIVPEKPLTPIPHVPAFVKGVFSLRGKVVSVLEVAGRLGLRRKNEQQEGKIIVLDASTDLFGLRVDSIDQVVEVDLEALEPPPEAKQAKEQDMVEGVFHHEGKTVAFLNLPMLLSFDVAGTGA